MDELLGGLSDAEQRLLARLSIFSDGFTIHSAQAVCAWPPLSVANVAETLQSLTKKSLLTDDPSGQRFHLSAAVRSIASASLRQNEENEQAATFLYDWSHSLCALASINFHGADQSEWLDRVDTEYENILGAIQLCQDSAEKGLELAARIIRYWMIRGRYDEGLRILEPLVLACPIEQNENLIAGAEVGIGNLYWLKGDVANSRINYVRAAEKGLKSDSEVLASAMNGLGNVLVVDGNLSGARQAYVEACSLNCLADNNALEAMNLSNIAKTYFLEGDLDNAHDYYSESEQINTKCGNVAGLLHSFWMLGMIAYHKGDKVGACDLALISICHSREIGERAISTLSIGLIGVVFSHCGNYLLATRLMGLSLSLATSVDYEIDPALTSLIEIQIPECRKALGEVSFETEFSLWRELQWPEAYEVAIHAAKSLVQT